MEIVDIRIRIILFIFSRQYPFFSAQIDCFDPPNPMAPLSLTISLLPPSSTLPDSDVLIQSRVSTNFSSSLDIASRFQKRWVVTVSLHNAAKWYKLWKYSSSVHIPLISGRHIVGITQAVGERVPHAGKCLPRHHIIFLATKSVACSVSWGMVCIYSPMRALLKCIYSPSLYPQYISTRSRPGGHFHLNMPNRVSKIILIQL